ncbi:MAG: metallophosphoesterase [Kofleriaceae bacterium]|nr:metallophosphoesterase [Kofleriaceae bacterium]
MPVTAPQFRPRHEPHPHVESAQRERHGIKLRRFAGSALYADQLEHPLRVAHLTDLHVGLVTPMKVQAEAAAVTNRLKPDLVVITGDFVCHSHAFLEDLTETLKAFDAPVFAVLGNHDYWAGAPGVRQAIKRSGAELLSNQNTVVTLRGQRLQLVGLDDAYTGHADRQRALRGAARNVPTLGLSHIAEEADGLWASGVPFVLSGHTHGGQIFVPGLTDRIIDRMGKRYRRGFYAVAPDDGDGGAGRRAQLYVTPGVGFSGVRVRAGDGTRAEVALFTLRAGVPRAG